MTDTAQPEISERVVELLRFLNFREAPARNEYAFEREYDQELRDWMRNHDRAHAELAEYIAALESRPLVSAPATETALPYPDALTPELSHVLGLTIMSTAPIGRLFRAAGAEIRSKVECEQAFVLHWLIRLVLTHGENWMAVAEAEMTQAQERAQAIKLAKESAALPPESAG